ncbi:hypothetical protein LEMLEM_LOCUS742 [Lemmus lemmus]
MRDPTQRREYSSPPGSPFSLTWMLSSQDSSETPRQVCQPCHFLNLTTFPKMLSPMTGCLCPTRRLSRTVSDEPAEAMNDKRVLTVLPRVEARGCWWHRKWWLELAPPE